ncbi:adenylate/guanylate cyclase domain-containing protein [Stenotrophomonas sp. DR822]|uniref:adenylate/guanylate cyclase domain-containing protein n=1 Tax=Stenotrophomonas sp. DR822 TaxID=2871174 RepID=UPI001C93932B|nr:adenylate/guanylate cyclase domain-containing protein [Stenotrophomonas sp. DR822]QZN80313.1 adenylate/guanylate cyclase domain-containing protein [Stenotrophomonas sp. DR822]
MGLKEGIEAEVDGVLATSWSPREGRDVPEAEDVALGSGAVKLDVAMLYADLAESTRIAMTLPAWLAAEIAKAFLATSCRIIRYHGGHIRSFDGDRVMGVFIGDDKCVRAAKAAFQINWTVIHVLRPKFSKYGHLAENGIVINHGTGIDAGQVFVARTGIRRNNDLVWIGRAPNIAAKLASVRESTYTTYVTDVVFSQLDEHTYYHYPPDRSAKRIMWELWEWRDAPAKMKDVIYRSNWWWRPPSG